MDNNEQNIGVDEKNTPEAEKKEENNFNDEVRDDLKNVYQGAKNYISDEDNQKKIKRIVKGGIIAWLIWIGIILIAVIGIFIFVFSFIFKENKQFNKNWNQTNNEINDTFEEMDADEFNFDIEDEIGTQYGSSVSRLLDNVVKKVKKNTDHKITVIYETTKTSKPDEITSLKKQFDENSQYEVSMDYDSKGYINKITISKN